MLTALLSASEMTDAEYTTYIALTLAFMIVMFLVALAAIFLVLFQNSNSEGIQGITASSETFFGKNKGRSIESKLKKWSWICLIIIAVVSIVIYIVQTMLA